MTWRYDPLACPFARAQQAQILARRRLIARQRQTRRTTQAGTGATQGPTQNAPYATDCATNLDTPGLPRNAPAQSPKQATGTRYEQLALAHLLQAGLQLLARNPRCRMGEIDLVMRDGEVIVFVEVRARADSTYGGAVASITPAKRARLIRTAAFLMPALTRLIGRDLCRRIQPAARFDVVAFEGDDIVWLRQAFALD